MNQLPKTKEELTCWRLSCSDSRYPAKFSDTEFRNLSNSDILDWIDYLISEMPEQVIITSLPAMGVFAVDVAGKYIGAFRDGRHGSDTIADLYQTLKTKCCTNAKVGPSRVDIKTRLP